MILEYELKHALHYLQKYGSPVASSESFFKVYIEILKILVSTSYLKSLAGFFLDLAAAPLFLCTSSWSSISLRFSSPSSSSEWTYSIDLALTPSESDPDEFDLERDLLLPSTLLSWIIESSFSDCFYKTCSDFLAFFSFFFW